MPADDPGLNDGLEAVTDQIDSEKVATLGGYGRAERARHVKTIVPTKDVAAWIAARIGVDPYRVLRARLELNPGEVLAVELVVTLSKEDLRELGFEQPQPGPGPETPNPMRADG